MPKNDIVIVDDPEVAGALVYWRLSGETHHKTLQDGLTADVPTMKVKPPRPTPEKALRRALAKLGARRRLVRPLEGGHGWALVEETATEDEVQHATACTAKVEADQLQISPANYSHAAEIRAGFDTYCENLTHDDVSTWLVQVVRSLDAVSLRDTGGIYFMPRTSLDTWEQVVGAVQKAGHHEMFRIPALRTSDAVEAIMDSVARDAEQAMCELEAEVEKENLSPRSLRTRAGRCSDIAAKIERYNKLLEANQGELLEKVEGLKAELVAAALAGEAEEDAA